MKSTNRLLPFLVFVTLFVMGEVWGSDSNAWGSKSATSGGNSSGSGNSGRPRSSGSSSGRTDASNQNKRGGTATWRPLPSSEASTLRQTPAASSEHRSGFLTKENFPLLPSPRTSSGIQTTTASPSTSSTPVPTTTQSGIRKSSASVEACVDDNSPAESCFDYFKLAIFWYPGYAYKQSLAGHSVRVMEPGWVIHGLWPSMYSKDAIIPPRCNRRTSGVTFNTHRFHENKLGHNLAQFWVTVLKSGFKTNEEVWEHEFQKHGDCATRSTAIEHVYGYFSKTYELFKNLQISTLLSKAGYTRGTTAKLRNIIEIIENKVQTKVIIDYVTDATKETPVNYLAEVFVCYDLKLNRIDCPNSWRPNSELDKQVIYSEQGPSIPTTTRQPPAQQDDSIKNRRGATTRRGRARARRNVSNSYSFGIGTF